MKKKTIAAVSIISVVGIIASVVMLSGFTFGSGNKQTATQVRATALKKGDIATSVSVTGTVHSAETTKVYSSLSYAVNTVNVKVGDKVVEGDILAELDTTSLQSDIAQKKASVSASQATAQQSLAVAQKDLETYQRNSEDGYDSSLLSADSSVTTAELDVQSAELDVQSAGNDLRTARQKLSDARNGEGDYEEVDATDSQLADLRSTVYAKETALEKAQTGLEKAQAALEKAKASNEAAKVSNSDSLSTYQDKVTNATLATNFNEQWIAIQKLETDLSNATITAPVSGTVTAVLATEGASGNGLLFVIENTDNLVIKTTIKEYDVESVSVGDRVTIKADATGDASFNGTLSYIAPTTVKDSSGETQDITSATFEAEVTVDTSSSLKIGVNTRMSIITEEKKDVYSVPFDAVAKSGDESVVYAAVQQEDGSYAAEAVTVTTGLENDLYIEIAGDGLSDGMHIISSADGISQGLAVEVQGLAAGAADSSGSQQSGGTPPSGGGGVMIPGMGGGPRG